MKDKPAPQGVSSARRTSGMRIPRMPLEWIDSGTWRLPSGQALAEFALQSGFLAPLLFPPESGLGRVNTSELPRHRVAKAGSR